MSLIHDIQAAAISSTNDVATLLRKCKLLAARLGHAPFAQWVEWELGGYPADVMLPAYRVVEAVSMGHFVGSFQRQATLQIPLSVVPERHRDAYRNARLAAAISAYQRLAAEGKGGHVSIPWPAEAAVAYGSKATLDMQCIQAWTQIPIGAIDQLLDAVKSAALGFAIDIERANPDAGEAPIGTQPISETKMTQIFNTNIAGSVGNVANGGTGFTQTAQVAVGAGDWDGLRRQLLALGLKDADFAGLQADLDEAKAKGSGLEGKPRSWMAKLVGKAIEGAAGVGVEALAGGVAKAIGGYLGVS
ncbi:hypothetical protein [Cupriavidus basilensis]|uniref:AbiTii domain-containing protein n=1 Tax=Cupriavidus basilensis TaxID=68895 RepID=UPI0039F6D27C